jgi:DNA-binding response OmpR family regulator
MADLTTEAGGAVTVPRKILAIDDEPDVGRFIASGSRIMGFHCVSTTDATEFLKELVPDTVLIFLDLMMPEMDGIELLRLLSVRECKVPIVLMSGVGSRVLETAEQLALTLGLSIIGHLNKPFRLKELKDILTNWATPISVEAKPFQQDGVPDEELRAAVAQDQFELHYQPQIAVATGKVVGVEALVRWMHPVRGLIFPDQFINRVE